MIRGLLLAEIALLLSTELSAIEEKYICSYALSDSEFNTATCRTFLLQNTKPPYDSLVRLCETDTSYQYFVRPDSPNHKALICQRTDRDLNDTDEQENPASFTLRVSDDPISASPTENDITQGGYYDDNWHDDNWHDDNWGPEDNDPKPKRGGRYAPPYLLGSISSGVQMAGDLIAYQSIELNDIPINTPVYFRLEEMSDNTERLVVNTGNQHLFYMRSSLFSEFRLIDTAHIYDMSALFNSYASEAQNKNVERSVSESISRETLAQALAFAVTFSHVENIPINQMPHQTGASNVKVVSGDGKTRSNGDARRPTPYSRPFQIYDNNPGDPDPSKLHLHCDSCPFVADSQPQLVNHKKTNHPINLESISPERFLGVSVPAQPAKTKRALAPEEQQALKDAEAEQARQIQEFKNEILTIFTKYSQEFCWTPLTGIIESLVPEESILVFRRQFFELLEQRKKPTEVFEALIEMLQTLSSDNQQTLIVNLGYAFTRFISLAKNSQSLPPYNSTTFTQAASEINSLVNHYRAQDKIPADTIDFNFNRPSKDEIELAIHAFTQTFNWEYSTLAPTVDNNFVFLSSVATALKNNQLLPKSFHDEGFRSWITKLGLDIKAVAEKPYSISEWLRRTKGSVISKELFFAGVMLLDKETEIRARLIQELKKHDKQLKQSQTASNVDSINTALGCSATLWLYIIRDVPGQTTAAHAAPPEINADIWIQAAKKIIKEYNSYVDPEKMESILIKIERQDSRIHDILLSTLNISCEPKFRHSLEFTYFFPKWESRPIEWIDALLRHKQVDYAVELADSVIARHWQDATRKQFVNIKAAFRGNTALLLDDFFAQDLINEDQYYDIDSPYRPPDHGASILACGMRQRASFQQEHFTKIRNILMKYDSTRPLIKKLEELMYLNL